MCYKYKNKYDSVFIYCDEYNKNQRTARYLNVFRDTIDDYYDNYNYCSYCGAKLEEKLWED